MKLVIDPKLCIGCGTCVVMANKMFDLDQNKGIAKIVKQPKDKQEEELAVSAIEACPVAAIKILKFENESRKKSKK